MSRGWRIGRVIVAACLFAWSLLIVVPAPRMPLFYLALGATEFGHWLALPAIALALAGSRRPRIGSLTRWLALAAAILFLSPAIRAANLARSLPATFTRAFAELGYCLPPDTAPPFRATPMWFSGRHPAAEVETFNYSTAGAVTLSLDFFRCPTRALAPCVIVIHGGGWNSGRRTEFPNVNQYLAAQGYAVAAIEYRLAPEFAWPAQRDDVHAALRYLREHAARLDIDPLQFVLMGRSAGGQIAEAVAYGAEDSAIRGCIALYAPADLHFAYRYADPKDILNSYQLLRDYLGGSPDEMAANYDTASGILQVNGATVPTLLMHGRRDELVWHRQSARLAATLRAANVPHVFVELPWAVHAFDYSLHGPGGQITAWSLKHFLDAVTHRGPVAVR